MSDEVMKIKAELQILNGRVQAERNDEVRHGLQRGRLEAERTQLLVKLIEAMAPAATAPAVVSPTTTGPYLITMTGRSCAADDVVSNMLREATAAPGQAPSRARPARRLKRSVKPVRDSTTTNMIFQVLQEAADGSGPTRSRKP